MPRAEPLAEARRLMTICNACRYCQGLCAVFPSMSLHRAFQTGDLHQLANLCHACGACYYGCQYASPHEFDVNVPRALAALRADTYREYVWPRALAGVFERNGLAVALVTALAVAAFVGGFVAYHDPGVLFGVHTGEGAFFRLMPYGTMVALFGGVFLYAIAASALGVRRFWRAIGGDSRGRWDRGSLRETLSDVLTLRYLDGDACMNEDDRPGDRRRLYHHLTFYGFLLCTASTSIAALFHSALDWPSPYPWYSPPVVLGSAGGIGLLVGPAGLLAARWRRDPDLDVPGRGGMATAFLFTLLLTSSTGLLLLVLRETAAMGSLLAIHLGAVFALFLSLPYGHFVHGLYRSAALLDYARKRRHVEERDRATASAPSVSAKARVGSESAGA